MTIGGRLPISVVMLSLNEAHSLPGVLENILPWASQVFLVDSYSSDDTIDIALAHGIHVVQRRFSGFGDQWNFALRELPITTPWTMKLDPDERLSDELKVSIGTELSRDRADALSMSRRLWFMGHPLPVEQTILRAWRTGLCRFSDVEVNEHPIVEGRIKHVPGYLEHHDSPSLQHWYEKQNRYTTAEAVAAFRGAALSAEPRVLGSALERRMWIKKHWRLVPFRYQAMFLAHYLGSGAWRAGRTGLTWARLRTDVFRMIEDKLREMQTTGREADEPWQTTGEPDPRVTQY